MTVMSLIPKKKHHGFLSNKKEEADRLGRRAALTGVATVAGATVVGLFISPTLAVLGGLAGTAYAGKQAWEWIQFRAKWGLRF